VAYATHIVPLDETATFPLEDWLSYIRSDAEMRLDGAPAAVISSGHRLRLTLPAVQHDGGAFSGECLRYGPAARGAGHQRDPGVQGNESVMLLPVLKWQRVIPDTLLPPSAWRPRAAPMASITSARKWFPECKRGDLRELALPFEH
jgi:hypothetical protein